MKKKIKAVVFDIGGVVIKIDWKNSFKLWKITPDHSSHLLGEQKLRLGNFAPYLDYEKGKIDADTFYAHMVKEIGLELDYQSFFVGWNGCLDHVIHGVDEIMANLYQEVPIYALSNTNLCHEKHFRKLAVFRNFKHLFLSHDMGLRKPDPLIYQTVQKNLCLEAEEILFIDDLDSNLQAAKNQGWQTGKSLNCAKDTRAILKNHGLLFDL